jgi:hypothetical protein
LCSEAQVDILSHTDDGGVDDVKAGMLFTGCVEIGADMMKGKQKQREQKAQDYSTKKEENWQNGSMDRGRRVVDEDKQLRPRKRFAKARRSSLEPVTSGPLSAKLDWALHQQTPAIL